MEMAKKTKLKVGDILICHSQLIMRNGGEVRTTDTDSSLMGIAVAVSFMTVEEVSSTL